MPSVLITGASRGIGLEFARQYLEEGWEVHACARKIGGELEALGKKYPQLARHALDVTDHAAVDALARELKGRPLDVLINNAGIYGPRDPQFSGGGQDLASMDYKLWRNAFETNTIAPFKVTQALVPNLEKGQKKCVALISTEMASLAGMKNSGMVSTAYQSSKAALNMVGLVLSHELGAKGITVLLLHPGWVKTDMGGSSAPLAPEVSVKGLRAQIDKAGLKDTGSYRDYSGRTLAW